MLFAADKISKAREQVTQRAAIHARYQATFPYLAPPLDGFTTPAAWAGAMRYGDERLWRLNPAEVGRRLADC